MFLLTAHGAWGDWSTWTQCTQHSEHNTHGGATCLCRHRACDSPPPMNGGFDCGGDTMQVQNCTGMYSAAQRQAAVYF